MIGRVVSIKSARTAAILVDRIATHPLYKKTYKQSKKYLADDQIGVKLGDIVEFINCKPISKRKSFKIIKVLGKNFAELAEIELKEKAEQAISEALPAGRQVMPEQKKEVEKETTEVIVEKPKKKLYKKGDKKNGTA